MDHGDCSHCRSSGSVQFIPEVGQQVCSTCAAVSDDLQLYEPTNIHEVAYALGAPLPPRASSTFPFQPTGTLGWSLWSADREQSRRYNDLQRKPEVDARIRGTLNRLGHPGLFEQVDFLFQRARDESWKRLPHPSLDGNPESIAEAESPDQDDPLPSLAFLPPSLVAPRVNWGMSSLLLATACCYAVLRRQGVRIDLAAVSNAAQLPFPKVRTAFKRLHLLVNGAVRDVKLAHPDAFVHRIVAFFFFHLARNNTSVLGKRVFKFLRPFRDALPGSSASAPANSARPFSKTPFEAVEATALDLCALWWPQQTSSASTPAHLAAFAMVVFALEAHIKAPSPVFDIFRCTHAALEFDPKLVHSGPTGTQHAECEATFSRNAADHYRELCAALKLSATKIPWLSDAAPINKKRPPKQSFRLNAKSDAGGTASWQLARIDVIVHGLDVIDVWRSNSAKRSGVQGSDRNFDPADDAFVGMSSAPQNRADRQESEEHDSEREMDNDDIDCFVSSSSPTAALASRSSELPEETETLTVQDAEEVWPRIQQRLKAAGALDRPSTDHPIDLLSDDQVDQLLFDSDELSSLFRTDPAELAAFERTKIAAGDWPPQADRPRDQECVAMARSLHSEPTSAREIAKVPRDSRADGSSAATVPNTLRTRKRASRSEKSNTVGSVVDPQSQMQSKSPSQSRASKRVHHAATQAASVTLREQQEESDWSD